MMANDGKDRLRQKARAALENAGIKTGAAELRFTGAVPGIDGWHTLTIEIRLRRPERVRRPRKVA